MTAVAAMVIAAACGGDDDGAGPATDAPIDAETTTTVAETTTTIAETTTTVAETTTTVAETTTTTTTEPLVDPVCPAVEGAFVARIGAVPDENEALVVGVLEQELGSLGVEFQAVNAMFDPNMQLADIERFIADGAQVLVVDPIPADAVFERLAAAAADGLIVITQAVALGAPATGIVFDPAGATAAAVERLAGAVGDGPVAAVFGPDVIPDFAVQAEVFGATAAELGLTVADTAVDESFVGVESSGILAGWADRGVLADLAGIWTHQPISALGLAEGSDVPAIVTLGMGAALVDLIVEGRVVAAYETPLDVAARGFAHAAVAALCGESLPETIVVESIEVDADTVDDWVPPLIRAETPAEVELVIEGDRAVYVLR